MPNAVEDNEYEWIYTNGQFEKIPLPPLTEKAPRAEHVFLRPKWVSICGSDLYQMELAQKTPETQFRLGHEWIGEVKEVGADCRDLQKGDWVTATASFACYRCSWCKEGFTNLCPNAQHMGADGKLGALRTYLELPYRSLARIQGNTPPPREDVLLEVVAVAREIVKRFNLSIPLEAYPKRRTVILGAGPVGRLVYALLKEERSEEDVVLVECLEGRLESAKKSGCNVLSLGHAFLDPSKQAIADYLIDATSDYGDGRGGFPSIPYFLKKAGKCLIVGKYSKTPRFPEKELSFLGAEVAWMRGVPDEVLFKTVQSHHKKIEDIARTMITHVYSDKDVSIAFATAQAKSSCLKVLIGMEKHFELRSN